MKIPNAPCSILAAADNSFEICNVYTKNCLSFTSNNRLQLSRCTFGLSVFFNWTTNGKLRGAYAGYQDKCIQIKNNSIITGDCSSNYSINWTCDDRTLKAGDWYLSWNIQTKEIQVVKTISGREALWVPCDTDNSVCDWPTRPHATSTPFVQPTSPPKERHSGNSKF